MAVGRRTSMMAQDHRERLAIGSVFSTFNEFQEVFNAYKKINNVIFLTKNAIKVETHNKTVKRVQKRTNFPQSGFTKQCNFNVNVSTMSTQGSHSHHQGKTGNLTNNTSRSGKRQGNQFVPQKTGKQWKYPGKPHSRKIITITNSRNWRIFGTMTIRRDSTSRLTSASIASFVSQWSLHVIALLLKTAVSGATEMARNWALSRMAVFRQRPVSPYFSCPTCGLFKSKGSMGLTGSSLEPWPADKLHCTRRFIH